MAPHFFGQHDSPNIADENIGGHLWEKLLGKSALFEKFREGLEEEVRPGGKNVKKRAQKGFRKPSSLDQFLS